MWDISIFKKASVWAIIVPAVSGVWALTATIKMAGNRSAANRQWDNTKKVEKQAQKTLTIIRQSGGGDLPGAASRSFDAVTSARACAMAALIPEQRLVQLESSKPSRQKDGSLLYREKYELDNVRLLQVAQFVDYAERNYALLNCTNLMLEHVRGKTKDNWGATISLEYLKEQE